MLSREKKARFIERTPALHEKVMPVCQPHRHDLPMLTTHPISRFDPIE